MFVNNIFYEIPKHNLLRDYYESYKYSYKLYLFALKFNLNTYVNEFSSKHCSALV